jgi:hypothetical protein
MPQLLIATRDMCLFTGTVVAENVSLKEAQRLVSEAATARSLTTAVVGAMLARLLSSPTVFDVGIPTTDHNAPAYVKRGQLVIIPDLTDDPNFRVLEFKVYRQL